MSLKVIIDTNIYDTNHYDWYNAAFLNLSELIAQKKIKLMLCSITEAECKRHLRKNVKEAAAKVETSIQNLRKLADFDCAIDTESLISKALCAFDTFHSDAERLNAHNIDTETVIDDYAEIKAPFEANVKKGNEFKDEIAMLTIADAYQNRDNDDVFCIVSADAGFRKGIRRHIDCLRFKDLKSFLEFYQIYTNPELSHIRKVLRTKEVTDYVHSLIRDEIQRIPISINIADVIIEDDDITDVRLDDVAISILQSTEQTITIGINATVAIDIEYTYFDEEQSYYDRETSSFLFQTEVTASESHVVEIEFQGKIDIAPCLDRRTDENDSIESISYDWTKFTIDLIEEIETDLEAIDLDEQTCIKRDFIEINGPFNCDYDPPNICPDCGSPLDETNDGGNGFCIRCAPNH